MVDVRVTFRAPIRPTEDPERVRRAATNLFPDATVEVAERELTGETRSLAALAEHVRNQRIPDTARGVLWRAREPGGSVARFRLGKQAAFAGRANFDPQEGPLGEIEVELSAATPDDLEQAIYDVAPDTTVPLELARVPPSKRPPSDASPARP